MASTPSSRGDHYAELSNALQQTPAATPADGRLLAMTKTNLELSELCYCKLHRLCPRCHQPCTHCLPKAVDVPPPE